MRAPQAVAFTREPEERLVRKLSNAVCAVLTSPELSADPISESSLVNEETLELLDVLLVEELLDVLPVEELSVELSKLVSESYADCASDTSPELIALNRFSTSFPSALMPESLDVSLVVDDVAEVEFVLPVLGIA
jgi:hypothetical protein